MTAESGSGALEALSRETFHLMVLDRMLPDFDGIEVVEQLRTCDNRPSILMLTARTTLNARGKRDPRRGDTMDGKFDARRTEED